MLRFEGFFFNRITIISDGLQKKLKFHSAHILPLGAEQFNIANKNFNACTMNLIYIGTLSGRDIHKTILGVQSFLIQNPNIPLRYTIVGEGREGERKALEELVAQLGLSDIVELVGYVPNTQVTPYLEEATVGISFVPICERFQYQPPTKTYEYLAAGIPVMATATHENAKIINGSNGILIDDSAESFSENLGYMHRHINMYNSTIIKASVMENTWDKIILENAIPYFESISGEKK
jgi:glycosyltransferase involved in cell wall biosynthesis